MKSELQTVIREKIVDGLTFELPDFTRRDLYLPTIPNKALAIIGMRRSGKTTFLFQCLSDRLAQGSPREALLYFNFEDERLAEITAGDLSFLLEEYFSLHPELRDRGNVTFFLDEIQLVPNWEKFVRRLLDTERIQVFLSGSSARLLSREIASSMRGRAMGIVLHPFSFREALRHQQIEPDKPLSDLPRQMRSLLANAFRRYLEEGGFPEAQNISKRDRIALLKTYVDVAILRDVIERYDITNPTVLRWLLRHLLSAPAAAFSIQKFYRTLKSQGISVGKNTLHAFLGYLEDAFIVRSTRLHSASERRRMVNPKKAYPVDPGLISVYERTKKRNQGHAMETAVFLELERRGFEIGYLRTHDGYEIDFYASSPEGAPLLIQVAASVQSPETSKREIRALISGLEEYPNASALLLTDDSHPPHLPDKPSITWRPVSSWLLDIP